MTGTQLCLAIGIPTIALVLGMLGNGHLFKGLCARMSSLESSISARMSSLENRLLALEIRLSVLDERAKRG